MQPEYFLGVHLKIHHTCRDPLRKCYVNEYLTTATVRLQSATEKFLGVQTIRMSTPCVP